ncbi:hypothetical protein BH23BAC3_BH23BAC3_17240 [soil metagenome]
MDTIRIGIITSSDRASKGEYEDRSGPAIKEYWSERLQNKIEWVQKVVPDERELLEKTMISMGDDSGCSLICTTGSTGTAERHVTPEATVTVHEKCYQVLVSSAIRKPIKTGKPHNFRFL